MSENQVKSPKHYVAIGASAGGLEALKDFFSSLPEMSSTAFIVIQHLSPDFKSVMVDLLAKTTMLNVMQAEDGVYVEPGSLYLNPPGKSVMMAEGRLLLSDLLPRRGTPFPIDTFFKSFAEDCMDKSIAIIMSGTGSDGSRGISAVKEVGGMVMVQSPESAKFDGMPSNSIQTGNADFVGDVKEIATKLTQYLEHPLLGKPLIDSKNLDDEKSLNTIYQLLAGVCDIDFSRYKIQTVSRRITRRMGLNGHTSIKDYLTQLHADDHELNTLAKEMLIGVTRFFRDTEAFERLEDYVFPDLIRGLQDEETLRIWSAGCSSGEEAISLAILADEAVQKSGRPISIKVLASDVESDAINLAGAGTFAPNIVEDLGDARLAKYFILEGDSYVLIPRIRKMIVFAVHNLITDPPFSNIHLSVCRNVLIYFKSEAQQRVLEMLLFSLRTGGYLFLGASESHAGIKDHVSVIDEKYKLFRKESGGRETIEHKEIGMKPMVRKKTPSVEQILSSYESENPSVYSALMEAMLESNLPPSILVNDSNKILHFYGAIEDYTINPSRGKVSFSLHDVMLESLGIPIVTAIKKVKDTNSVVVYENVHVTLHDGSIRNCNIKVQAYRNTNRGPQYFLVNIVEAVEETLVSYSPPVKEGQIVERFDVNAASLRRIQDLEDELESTKERLSLTIEELEATNEELQSSNEELLASNEELQSTNEELHSVNEELYTINSEYQLKIDELSVTNHDLDTVISSIETGIIFLDYKMTIRRYSPSATRHVNLVKSDVGRPFHHISHNLDCPTLLNEIARVISTGNNFTNEIELKSGGFAIIRIAACPSEESQEEYNCVLSITDISNMRSIEGGISQAYKQLRRNVASHSLIKDKHFRIFIAEDDVADVEILKHSLQAIPDVEFQIESAQTPDAIVKSLTENDWDLCFLDFQLGPVSAIELFNGVDPKLIDTPIILFSETLTPDKHRFAFNYGVFDTILKRDANPVLLAHLLRFVMQQKSLEDILRKNIKKDG